jgi:hypothetical protein
VPYVLKQILFSGVHDGTTVKDKLSRRFLSLLASSKFQDMTPMFLGSADNFIQIKRIIEENRKIRSQVKKLNSIFES